MKKTMFANLILVSSFLAGRGWLPMFVRQAFLLGFFFLLDWARAENIELKKTILKLEAAAKCHSES